MSEGALNHRRFLLQHLVPQICLALFGVAATCGAFIGGLWATLGLGGGVILYAMTVRATRQWPKPDLQLVIFAFAALFLMALLTLHSTVPEVSWPLFARLASIFLPLTLWSCPFLLRSCEHPQFIKRITIAVALGALALGLELFFGAPLLKMIKGQHAALTEYNRGLSYLVLLAFPLMAGLLHCADLGWTRRQRLMIITLFVVILLFPAGLTESRAAKLALVAGLLITALAHLWPVFVRRCLGLLPFLLIGWPFMAQEMFRSHYEWLKHLPDSWRARMEIWDYMSYRIAERPWLGWGLGTSHLLPFRQPDGDLYLFTTIPAAHPHNLYVELWAELGVPGLALGVVFLLLMLKKAGTLPQKQQPFALGAFVAAFCLSLVAYDFWTDSLWSAFALTAAAFALNLSQTPEKGHAPLEN